MSKAHLFAPMKWVKEQFSKLNSDKLHIRDASTQNTVEIEKGKYTGLSSLIPYQSGDICVVRSTSNHPILATPFVNSSGIWCAFIYNIGDYTLSSGIHFDILNKG